MSHHHWDELTKTLAEESLPRRESLRRIGLFLAGAAVSPLGLATAWAAPKSDPCKAFCKCSNKKQQNACLAACRECNGDPRRLCGTGCGNYFCCGELACCGNHCVDLDFDVFNCGSCGHVCWPGPYEDSACFEGECVYTCVAGAVVCDGKCSLLDHDPDNCGACGNVCGGDTPDCLGGRCGQCGPGLTNCFGECVNLRSDLYNCGACGNVCWPWADACISGKCTHSGDWSSW